jgi:hypothetical protein
MKKPLHATLLILCFLTFKTSFGQLSSYQSYFSDQLSGWTKTIKGFSLTKFKKTDTIYFEGSNYLSFTKLKDFYPIYRTIIQYSPDSSQFTDIYSYELNLQRDYDRTIATTNVEQGISLCNLKTKQWTRILTLGPDDGIEDLYWISNQAFIMVGYSFDKAKKRRPVIYIASLIENSFTEYMDDSQVSTGYQTPEYKKLHVEQEQ